MAHNNSCPLKPYGGNGGGHHVHQKKAFEGNPNYDLDKALALSNEDMAANGWRHAEMTKKQQELQRELARSGRPNTMAEQTRIAVEALKAGGVPEEQARRMVAESLNNLRNADVRTPTKIPWQK